MRVCRQCGRDFEFLHQAQHYCSERCKKMKTDRPQVARSGRGPYSNPVDPKDHEILREIYPEFYEMAKPQRKDWVRRKCLKCGEVRSIFHAYRICPKCTRRNARIRHLA